MTSLTPIMIGDKQVNLAATLKNAGLVKDSTDAIQQVKGLPQEDRKSLVASIQAECPQHLAFR